MTTTDALKRVAVRLDPTQDEAAHIHIDATGGGDRAHLTVNPELVDAQAQQGYVVKAGISAVLEGFRRYNRAVTRKYGTYADEQHLFDQAMERATAELEQLVHHGPGGDALARPDGAPAPEVRSAGATLL